MMDCACCDKPATHILVNYNHEVIGDVYCQLHAFKDGREECPCCYDYYIEIYDEDAEKNTNLLPTYPKGTLDSEGCCSEHP